MDMDNGMKDKINQLQLNEQKINTLIAQKQQFQAQLMEVTSALQESESSDRIYKIIGNIMVSASKDKISDELGKKKEILELRIKSLEKQEESTRSKAKELQQEVLKSMKDSKS